MLDDVRIRLLGPVELVPPDDGPAGRMQQLLLAVLALAAGQVVVTDRLVDALWPESRPSGPRRTLQVHVSKLRGALEHAGVGGIDHRSGGYVLTAPATAIDAVVCERAIDDASQLVGSDPERAGALLRTALGAWRGRPLAGLGDGPVVADERRRLDDLHLRGVEARIAADLACGRHADVVDEVRGLVDAHPFRETLREHLVRALYGAGRQAEALAAFEDARRLLADELGADPSPALQRLHQQVLSQDPSLGGDAAGDTGPPSRRHASVAVLPFSVIGELAAARDLAVGLHADLLTELTRVPGLTVISRSSVLPYGDTDDTPRAVARALDVAAVVEGTVQSAGGRLRVSVQLVDGGDGAQRWADRYDRELTAERLFDLQDDLAADVAAALSAELVPRAAGAGAPTRSLDAWRAAAAARHHFEQKTPTGFREAVAGYERAIELDPDYVDAWTGLADSLVSEQAYGHGDRGVLLARAQTAVHRAVSLDPVAPRARTSMGVLHVAYQDAPAAIGELEHALRLQPGQADAHNWLTWVRLLVGRPVLPLARRAAELDPLAAEAHAHLALAFAGLGRARDGVAAARRARELSSYGTAVLYEAACLQELGRHDDVLELLDGPGRDALGVPWAEPGPDALVAISLAASGRRDRARARLEELGTGDAADLAAGLVLVALDEQQAAQERFARVAHLRAWSCLVVHQFHGWLWAQAPELHDHVTAVALRSWGLEPQQSER